MFIEDDSGYGTAWTTTTTPLASQWGLLINIDSATGDTPITTTWFVEDEKYWLYAFRELANVSAEIDTAVTRTGTRTAKISNTNAAGKSHIFLWTWTSPVATTTASRSKYWIPIKASTKYKLGCWVKTNNAAASSVYISFASYTDAGVRTLNVSTKLTWTNDWTYLTVTATTWASDTTWMIWFSQDVAWNISDAWFDINSMTLEEVIEPVANSLITPSPSLVSFTAVGSTDNIDQSFASTTNSSVIWSATWVNYRYSQSFTPTKSKLTSIYLYKKANVWTPTGDFKVEIRNNNWGDPWSTVLATVTIPLATYNALSSNAEFWVNVPTNLTPWTLYHIVAIDTATEVWDNSFLIWRLTAGGYTGWDNRYSIDWGTVWIVNGTSDLYFNTRYYKPTTNFKASQNNSTVSISADEDGFAEWAVINLLTGAYVWGLWVSATDLLTSSSIYSATAWPWTAVGTQTILNNYGFFTYAWYNWIGTNSTANTLDVIWKFTTTQPITWDVVVSFRAIERTTGTTTVAYSTDNSSYTTVWTLTNSANSEVNYSYTIPWLVGETNFFIRFRRAGTASKIDFANLAISTTVNTSSVNWLLKNYPTNKDIIKQYATTLSGATTSATYRATKWGFPAIEYSATEYQFLDVDTTATGSTVAFSELGSSYTTVADWASLAISSTSTPNLFVKANITANRLYLASNDYNASSDKDWSLKETVTYQVVQ